MDELLSLKRSEIVSIFNDELKTFLSELLKIVNNLKINNDKVEKLLSYKSLIETGIMANVEIAINMFTGYIFGKGNDDFCKKITERDYNFFLNMEEQIDKKNNLVDIIVIIKEIFLQLSENNRESIFGYLENLSTLGNIFVMKKLSNN
jgi:hypothetical protein